MVHVATTDQVDDIRQAVEYDVDGAKTVGVYRYPARNEAVCPGMSGGCKEHAWTRAIPGGYLVHACGKRRPGIRARIRGTLLDMLGINLLPRDVTPATFQNPEGWPDAKHPPIV